ncbi:hypothetical protein OQL13_000534 [Clostridium perfringens]
MGEKLDRDQELQSVEALQKYYFDNNHQNGPFNTKVEVLSKKGRKLAFNANVSIVIAFDSSSQKISIMWEDDGFDDFRDIQLFGTYNCHYTKMKYIKTKKILEINSSDSNKIVRVYVP